MQTTLTQLEKWIDEQTTDPLHPRFKRKWRHLLRWVLWAMRFHFRDGKGRLGKV